LFAAIRRRRRKTTSHGGKTPFLDIGFDEDESRLSKINVYCAGAIGTDCWEEVLRFQAVGYIFELLAIAREENSTCAWAVSYTDNITLNVCRCVVRGSKWLVVSSMATGCVCNRILVPTYSLLAQP
jgi:hypothetical protein